MLEVLTVTRANSELRIYQEIEESGKKKKKGDQYAEGRLLC
jgi:hypothetical protein